jgi:YD repeat-containing protein
VTGSTTRTYAYDRTGVPLSQSVNGGAAVSFASDVLGNLTAKVESDGSLTGLRYDSGSRLVAIDRPATSADPAFGYDAAGQIRDRTIAGVTETYAYLGLSETVHRISPSSGSITDGLLGPSGERLALTVGSTLDWTLFDGHDDLAGLLDTSGSVVRALRYVEARLPSRLPASFATDIADGMPYVAVDRSQLSRFNRLVAIRVLDYVPLVAR